MEIEMNEQEINTTIELLNIAIKAGGYNVAKPAVFLIDKFVAKLPQKIEKNEEKTE